MDGHGSDGDKVSSLIAEELTCKIKKKLIDNNFRNF